MYAYKKNNNNNQLERNTEHMNSNVETQISLKSPLDIRHNKQIHKKSNNKVNQLWKVIDSKDIIMQ